MLVDVVDILSVTDNTDIVVVDVTVVSVECITGDCSANSEYSILMMQFNHSLDDGTTGLVVTGVSVLGEKVDISSVTVDVSIVVFTSVECDTVGCTVLAI